MRNSHTSQAEAEQHGLATEHRYWYGLPVASELPFDRGGLGTGGLSSSAQDMARYLGLYLNDGRSAPLRWFHQPRPPSCNGLASPVPGT